MTSGKSQCNISDIDVLVTEGEPEEWLLKLAGDGVAIL